MKNFIAIDKYGCFYDPKATETCPMNADGTPDLNGTCHVDDIICDERDGILEEIDRVMKNI